VVGEREREREREGGGVVADRKGERQEGVLFIFISF